MKNLIALLVTISSLGPSTQALALDGAQLPKRLVGEFRIRDDVTNTCPKTVHIASAQEPECLQVIADLSKSGELQNYIPSPVVLCAKEFQTVDLTPGLIFVGGNKQVSFSGGKQVDNYVNLSENPGQPTTLNRRVRYNVDSKYGRDKAIVSGIKLSTKITAIEKSVKLNVFSENRISVIWTNNIHTSVHYLVEPDHMSFSCQYQRTTVQ